MNVTPFQLVQDVNNLVSMPEVLLSVNRMVDDPSSSAVDVGKVIAKDPGLTARLLKIANSPYYGPGRRIDTVARAVTLMGMRQLRDLVLATAASKVFNGIPNSLISMDDFWRHSIQCALAASSLAKLARVPNHDSLFVAGLLHDVGQLILFNRYPTESHQTLLLCMADPGAPTVYEAERRIFDFDHTQIGAELLRHWRLPESLQTCIEFHHEPSRAPLYAKEAYLVHLANAITGLMDMGSSDITDASDLDPQVWPITGLTPELTVSPIITVVEAQFGDVWESLTG